MITLRVPDGETATIDIAGYTFFIARMASDRVVVERWIDGQHHVMDLNPVEDAKPRVDPRDVPLDRNLTELRLPESARKAETIRVIVWETDADTGARSILDIVEGGRREIIRWFNRYRRQWAEQGRTNTARIEVVPDDGWRPI